MFSTCPCPVSWDIRGHVQLPYGGWVFKCWENSWLLSLEYLLGSAYLGWPCILSSFLLAPSPPSALSSSPEATCIGHSRHTQLDQGSGHERVASSPLSFSRAWWGFHVASASRWLGLLCPFVADSNAAGAERDHKMFFKEYFHRDVIRLS